MRALLIRTTGRYHPGSWKQATVQCKERSPCLIRSSACTTNHHRLLSSTTPDSKGAAVPSVPSSTTNPDSDDSYTKDAKLYDSYVSSVQNTARSVQSSMYSYTSGRAQRRREQQRARRQQRERRKRLLHDNDNTASVTETPEQDTRTIADLLFPNPFKGMNVPEPRPWPSTLAQWRHVIVGAWQDYMWTWRGFWAHPGFIVQDPLDEQEGDAKVQQKGIEETIEDNVKRNTTFLKEEAQNAKTQFQDTTGIYTMADVKEYAAKGLQLATECVKEFMQGYRKGRDEEVENMLTKYLQEFQSTVGLGDKETKADGEAKEQHKRRRKIRPRVQNRFHASLLHPRVRR